MLIALLFLILSNGKFTGRGIDNVVVVTIGYVIDVDNDGDPDIISTNFPQRGCKTTFINKGDGIFFAKDSTCSLK